MKKVIFSLVAIVGLGLASNTANAQAVKIGYFDVDQMVQAMPEFKTIQKKIEAFEKDSLAPQRDNIQLQYDRMDSTYKTDSLAKKPKATLDYERGELTKFATQLYYWPQMVQNAKQQKFAELSKPTYDKVVAALKKVVAAQKINVVLKPQVFEVGTDETVVTNLFIPVAKALGVDLKAAQNQGEAPAN